jgi:alkylhydroperoxidase family enzyme
MSEIRRCEDGGSFADALKQVGAGQPTGDAKRDALVRVVRNLAETSGTISRDEFTAIKKAGYTDARFVEISLAIGVTVFTNVFKCINNATVDFSAVEVVATT